jgi:hypothetical protein
VDKDGLARRVGFPARFGQSPFAIARGNAFEARVKADGCAGLLRLLRERLGPDVIEVVDHPPLRLDVGGRVVHLEPDLVALRHAGAIRVVEIKSFPVVDGRADGTKVAAAATQAAVYVLALRRMLGSAEAVSPEVVLVCPEDFANTPVAVPIDVRRQLIVLEHQLARLARVEALLSTLPGDLSLDPSLPAADLTAAVGQIEARYAPACLAACELAYFCRDEAAGRTAALGLSVREDLGGVETVAEALALADGALTPSDDRADAAALLRTAARLYDSALGAVPPGPAAAGPGAAVAS